MMNQRDLSIILDHLRNLVKKIQEFESIILRTTQVENEGEIF